MLRSAFGRIPFNGTYRAFKGQRGKLLQELSFVNTRNSLPVVVLSVLGLVPVAQAAFVQGEVVDGFTFIGTFRGNDCGGAGGFSACVATQAGTGNGISTAPGLLPSASIYKLNNGGAPSIGSYASITGVEFTLNFANGILDWGYTPGQDDPAIHYFTVKQGPGYALFYSAAGASSWTANIKSGLGYNNYSHVTWFNGALHRNGGGEVPVPTPSVLSLLGLGLLGLAWARRRA